mmetsp:Transcript_4091/g.10468  ORF Transcript_4091/g.10468 Transcript_4091/m.10468 type:complete len:223 (-) Transcript_4091:639-1307(-)
MPIAVLCIRVVVHEVPTVGCPIALAVPAFELLVGLTKPRVYGVYRDAPPRAVVLLKAFEMELLIQGKASLVNAVQVPQSHIQVLRFPAAECGDPGRAAQAGFLAPTAQQPRLKALAYSSHLLPYRRAFAVDARELCRVAGEPVRGNPLLVLHLVHMSVLLHVVHRIFEAREKLLQLPLGEEARKTFESTRVHTPANLWHVAVHVGLHVDAVLHADTPQLVHR